MNRPLAPFALLLAVALGVLFMEYQAVRGQFDAVSADHASNEAKRVELEGRNAKVTALKTDLPTYQEAFDQLLGAYTPAPLEANALGALYNLNPIIRVEDAGRRSGNLLQPVSTRPPAPGAKPTGPPMFNYELTSTSVEFHKFVPALAETENALPLLRFTKLSLISPQDPFFMEATALNITGTFTTLREGAVGPAPKEAGK